MGIRSILHNIKDKYILTNYYRKLSKSKEKVVYFIGSEDFGNLGDHHISVSEIKFIRHCLGDKCHIEEISSTYFYYKIDYVRKYIRKQDIICTQGGGNFGNQYINAEEKRRKIIEYFPDNKIIIFPQTVFYTDDEKGRRELQRTKNCIEAHKNLHIFTREEKSFLFAKNNFKTNVYLTPDIVLSDRYADKCERSGITLCLRHDVERRLTDLGEKYIKDMAAKFRDKVTLTDTQLDYHVSLANRQSELKKVINLIRSSELVVTDRLHGMVFCAITGTPCIVMSNYNYKVKGVYEWIKDLRYISFLDDMSELEGMMKDMLELKREECRYNREKMLEKFLPLKEVLVNE